MFHLRVQLSQQECAGHMVFMLLYHQNDVNLQRAGLITLLNKFLSGALLHSNPAVKSEKTLKWQDLVTKAFDFWWECVCCR